MYCIGIKNTLFKSYLVSYRISRRSVCTLFLLVPFQALSISVDQIVLPVVVAGVKSICNLHINERLMEKNSLFN